MMKEAGMIVYSMYLTALTIHAFTVWATILYARAAFRSRQGGRLSRFVFAASIADIARTIFVIAACHIAMADIPPGYIHDSPPWGWILRVRLSLFASPLSAPLACFRTLPMEFLNLWKAPATAGPALLHIALCVCYAARTVALFTAKAGIPAKLLWWLTYWFNDIMLRIALGFC